METEEVIQEQMQQTRDSLTEKLETLEHKVLDTVTEARSAVNHTVESIKESVQGTVTSVNETVKESVDTVKEWVDVKAHVRQHPWLMVGGSVAVGFGLATLLSRSFLSSSGSSSGAETGTTSRYASDAVEEAHREEPAPRSTESVLNAFQPEIAKLKSLAVGALVGAAREMLLKSMPEHIGQQLKETIDHLTEKMGGDPLPASDWAGSPSTAASQAHHDS